MEMKWTQFPDHAALSKTDHETPWGDLVAQIRRAGPFANKNACPWVKLATFGIRRTDPSRGKYSLRNNENVTEVHGIEGDYDGEVVAPEHALALLEAHGIRAAVYTSPSHTPEAPRWRVICPLTTPVPPEQRAALLARLNGALGGILAPESFTLSQSYYFGRVEGAMEYKVLTTFDDPDDGTCVDDLPELEAIAKGKPSKSPAASPGAIGVAGDPLAAIAATRQQLGRPLKTGDNRREMLKSCIASRSARGVRGDDLLTLVRGIVATYFDPADPIDERDIAELVHWASDRDTQAAEDAARIAAGLMLPSIQPQAWDTPTELPNCLPAVLPFDAELLPHALRGWVADIAHRMQCPPDFPAVGAMVALSSLVGARAVIAPKARDDWRVVPNMWGVIVGRPGVMKSPALSEVLKPLHRLEATEREQWAKARDEWDLDCKVADMAGKQREKQAGKEAAKNPDKARELLQPVETPDEPRARRYVVNDATVEKLGELLEFNTWGTLSYRDELHGLLTSMDKPGQEGARAFYLQAYDGNQGYTVDRIIRGTHYIPRVCLAMLGGMQPGKIQSYVRDAVGGGSGDDGLLQRFGLTVWPDVNTRFEYVDKWPEVFAKQTAWAVFERLNDLQPASETDPQEWRFTPAAQAIFEEWIIPFETELRGDTLHPALVSHLSKYRKLVPALALLCALVDTPDSGNLVDEQELLRALAWGEYLRPHAERVYSAAVMPETSGAQALLTKLRTGKLCDADGVMLDSFTPRQIAVKHWAGLGKPEDVRKAAELLTDYGWLARDTPPGVGTGRSPGERFLLHPCLLNGA